MVAEVSADFVDRPLVIARATRVFGLWEVFNLSPEFARERVQPLHEIQMPAAPRFAAWIRERAD